MSSEEALLVGAAVTALTQFAKWAGIDERRGPVAVILLSLLGVLLWSFSTVPAWDRALVWSIFSGWVNVLLTAAGIYGFTRAMPEAVSSFTKPPTGAGSEPVASMSAAGHEDELIPMTDDEREEILAATRALGPAEVARVLGMLRARHERYERAVGPLDDEGTERRD
jgi:hypothetical protein